MTKKCGLFIDVGNTSIKIGVGDERSVISSSAFPTDVSYGAEALGERLSRFVREASERAKLKLDGCVISSVVPAMDDLLSRACRLAFTTRPLFVHKDVKVPLVNRYDNPKEVGADRLVAAYGARALFPERAAIVVVDYGTATTFDCILEDAYLGGLICPGVASSFGALTSSAALLPSFELTEVEEVAPSIGKNTEISLRHGFFFSFVSMTEGVCARLSKVLPKPVFFIATGGFASNIARRTTSVNVALPDLILDGLRLLWLLEER